ncbi:MAG: hypothetical protein KA792_01295, partial [Bacteroidales bacterium]|nr:hypothetical protein [Bacteroidales bacterium]
MNKLCLLFINLILAVSLNAQAPQAFKYQAIARNNSAQVLVEKPIALRITILKDNSNGQSVYQETWKVTTNKLGLFNLDIGNGIPVLGSGPFSEILWGESIHFLKIEIDETGLGNNFSLMGISQLLSVPYSLYSEKSGSIEKITGEN